MASQTFPSDHAMPTVTDLIERVERLLLRHEELKKINDLLNQELAAANRERENLKSRLGAARARIDALLERLPVEPAAGESGSTGHEAD